MIVLNNSNELETFLKKVHLKSSYQLNKLKIEDQSDWTWKNGVLTHFSGGFFHPVGIYNTNQIEEQYLMLYQPQSALTGLIIHKRSEEIFVLLQARVEPGNSGITQYGPTIQSTAANYLRLHGGKPTSYFKHFQTYVPGTHLIKFSLQFDLGLRYFQKSKFHHYLIVDEFIETKQNMAWVSLSAIKDCICHDNFFNTDLRSLLGIFDWDSLRSRNESFSRHENHIENNFYRIINIKKRSRYNYQMISPENLKNWKINEYGITSSKKGPISIEMFKFSCSTREKNVWYQPLFCAEGLGLSQLGYRIVNNQYEFLLSVDTEPGITGGVVVLPSILYYPGQKISKLLQGKIVREILQSDEGGRFYLNESKNQIIELEKDYPIEENQIWVSINYFKHILESSNLVSIQLRQLTSIILDILNPETFTN